MHRFPGVPLALTLCAIALPGQQPPAGTPAAPPQPRFQHRLDGLFRGPTPAPAHLEVDGSLVPIAELAQRCEAVLADPAVHAPHLVVLDLLRKELERTGKWPTDAALADAFEKYREPYDSTPFTVKVIATRFKGYPSLEAFQERWRIVHAFAATLTGIDRDQLQQEAERWREFLGDGTVTVELWFFSALDDQRRWDFARAKERAVAAQADLRAGKDAAEVRSASDAVKAVAGWPDRAIGYNALRQVMGESEYGDLVQVGSAAHFVFHDAPPGELVGPLRAGEGYWLARVGQRHPSKRRFEVKDERTEQLVRDVLVQRLFLEWVDGVLAKAVLRVPADRSPDAKK